MQEKLLRGEEGQGKEGLELPPIVNSLQGVRGKLASRNNTERKKDV